jgi:hypothetical protein
MACYGDSFTSSYLITIDTAIVFVAYNPLTGQCYVDATAMILFRRMSAIRITVDLRDEKKTMKLLRV